MRIHPLAIRAWGCAGALDYELGRPGWPEDAVAALLDRSGATHVLDLAAGTGLLTRVLAEHADDVIAVEPLAAMRRELHKHLPHVRVLTGTAEAIPLADGAVDAVFVGQAFHWFDLPRASAEIARVLRTGGRLVVLWNRPGWGDVEWIDELDAIVERHHGDEPHFEGSPWREALAAEDRFGPLCDEEARHDQAIDREGLIARIASFSVIGGLPDDRRAAALAECRAVLERHGVDAVTLTHRTLITTTRRLDG